MPSDLSVDSMVQYAPRPFNTRLKPTQLDRGRRKEKKRERGKGGKEGESLRKLPESRYTHWKVEKGGRKKKRKGEGGEGRRGDREREASEDPPEALPTSLDIPPSEKKEIGASTPILIGHLRPSRSI